MISPLCEVIWQRWSGDGPLATITFQNMKISTATFVIEEGSKLWGGQAELHPLMNEVEMLFELSDPENTAWSLGLL